MSLLSRIGVLLLVVGCSAGAPSPGVQESTYKGQPASHWLGLMQNDADLRTRLDAARALVAIGGHDASAAEVLIEIYALTLKPNGDASVQQDEVVIAMGQLNPAEYVSIAGTRLSAADGYVRLAALAFLSIAGVLAQEEEIRLVSLRDSDPNDFVRRSAQEVLDNLDRNQWLVGTWRVEQNSSTFEYRDDGTFAAGAEQVGTWRILGRTLTLKYDSGERRYSFTEMGENEYRLRDSNNSADRTVWHGIRITADGVSDAPS